MTKFSQKDIQELAQLSCISLSENELDTMVAFMKTTTEHFNNLKDVDTSMSNPRFCYSRNRETVTRNGTLTNKISNDCLDNKVGGFVRVPQVLGGSDESN